MPILGKINVNKHSSTTFLGFQEKGTDQIHSTALNREISFKFVQLCLQSLNFQCYFYKNDAPSGELEGKPSIELKIFH